MIFVDVETQRGFFDENRRPLPLAEQKVSFLGAYDSDVDRYYSFWEDDLGAFEQIVKGKTIVGYNTWAFDYGVIAPYIDLNLWLQPSIDLMVAMKNTIGFRPKLDDLAKANLGEGKIGSGADALVYWANQDLESLEKYCLEDVRITYEIWKLGEDTGQLNYYDREGFTKNTHIDWQSGFMKKDEEVGDVQRSMF